MGNQGTVFMSRLRTAPLQFDRYVLFLKRGGASMRKIDTSKARFNGFALAVCVFIFMLVAPAVFAQIID